MSASCGACEEGHRRARGSFRDRCCPIDWRAGNSDDFENLSLCRSQGKRRHSRAAKIDRARGCKKAASYTINGSFLGRGNTKVASVVDRAEVEPSGEINLYISKEKLEERQCTLKEIKEAIESPKREVEIDEKRNLVKVRMGVDFATLHIHKNKILNQKVKGIPGIDHVTVVKEGDEWK